MTTFNPLYNRPVQMNGIERASVQLPEALNTLYELYAIMQLGDEMTSRSNGIEFVKSAAIYAVIGYAARWRGNRLASFSFGMPVVEKLTGIRLADLLAEAARQQQKLERQQQAERSLVAIAGSSASTPQVEADSPRGGKLALFSGTPIVFEPDAGWRNIIVHPSVILVLGKRGSGKSALAYRLLELFRYGLGVYVVGVPDTARNMLPEWIGVAPTLEDVPPKAIALVDEAYLSYHARGSLAAESKSMSQLLNLSRQREQTIIFVSQEARQVDRNIASSANVIVFKDLGILQLQFDRPELNKLASQAREAFSMVKGDRRNWSFVYAPDSDFLGLTQNQLPTFWKSSLSSLFADSSSLAKPRPSKRTTPQERAEKARAMHAQGASYGQIARVLGVKSRSTIHNYVRNYPYRPV